MTNDDPDALEACPFCGGEAVKCFHVDSPSRTRHWVLCRNCHACPGDRLSEAEAIAAWNRRATARQSAAKDAEIAELRARVAAAFNEDGESYRDMWIASRSNVARVAAKANTYRSILERLVPILREYSTFMLTYDFDMHQNSPDDCLEAEADAILAALGDA